MLQNSIMRINEDIVKDYIMLQNSIGQLIERYRVSQKDVYTAISMPVMTFRNKLKKNTFTANELLEICKYINSIP